MRYRKKFPHMSREKQYFLMRYLLKGITYQRAPI